MGNSGPTHCHHRRWMLGPRVRWIQAAGLDRAARALPAPHLAPARIARQRPPPWERPVPAAPVRPAPPVAAHQPPSEERPRAAVRLLPPDHAEQLGLAGIVGMIGRGRGPPRPLASGPGRDPHAGLRGLESGGRGQPLRAPGCRRLTSPTGSTTASWCGRSRGGWHRASAAACASAAARDPPSRALAATIATPGTAGRAASGSASRPGAVREARMPRGVAQVGETP
jgi:hypothetical protein